MVRRTIASLGELKTREIKGEDLTCEGLKVRRTSPRKTRDR